MVSVDLHHHSDKQKHARILLIIMKLSNWLCWDVYATGMM